MTILSLFNAYASFSFINTVDVIFQIKCAYNELPGLSFISVDECESLLLMHQRLNFDEKDRFGIVNLLVALCRQPWAVDVNLGSHGVCYYGCMGNVPMGLVSTFKALSENDQHIRGDCDFLSW